MTIKEINNLVLDEHNELLRDPLGTENYTKEELYMQKRIMDGINYLLWEDDGNGLIMRCVKRHVFLKLHGVNELKGRGTGKKPYTIETIWGSGSFYRANEIFPQRKTPKDIQKNHCYSNAQLFALRADVDCKVISGIGYMDHPFLHSVVQCENKIIDFNYNLVMDADLFFKLMKFEVLAELDSKTLKSSIEIYNKKRHLFSSSKIQTVTMSFAFEDFLDWLNDEERQQNENIGLKF